MAQSAEVLESVYMSGIWDNELGGDLDGVAEAMYGAVERQSPVHLAFPKRATRRSIIDESRRIVQAVISTSDVDRYYTIIDPEGIEVENFFKSGAPVLWSHGHTLATLGDVPIGKALSLKATSAELSAQWQWASFSDQPVERWGEVARAIEDLWYLYRSGHLGAYSVTILPKEIEPGRGGRPPVFRRSELLEFSLTSVPVNPHATAADEKAMRYFRKYVGVNAFPKVLQEAVTDAVRDCARNVALFTVRQELESFQARQALDEARKQGRVVALSFAKERFSKDQALERAKSYSFAAGTVQETDSEWVIYSADEGANSGRVDLKVDLKGGVKALLENTTTSTRHEAGNPIITTSNPVITINNPTTNTTAVQEQYTCPEQSEMSSGNEVPCDKSMNVNVNIVGLDDVSGAERFAPDELSGEEERASAIRVNSAGRAHAKKLIAAGDVDRDSDWSFDAEDGNKLLGPNGDDWENYSKFHLGIRAGTSEKTKEHYAYPYGKNGKVYRRGVIAAKQRAAQQGHRSIERVADELLQLIDKDKEEKKRSVRLLPHIAARVFGTPLLIEPQKLEVILGAIGEGIGAEDEGYNSGRGDLKVDGVAVIPVYGTLVYRTLGLHAFGMLTSYDQIWQMFQMALDDPTVSAILLDVDSPGGEAAGAFDLVDAIYQARGKKPIWAIANPEACSAAYAIASAADTVVAPRTAQVGSIGVYALHIDQSGFDEKMGLKYTFIHAGAHKLDGNPHEPISDGARERIQKFVDETYAELVKIVARNRGLTEDAVRNTEAQTFLVGEALSLGLIDRVMTFSQALAELAQRRSDQGTQDVQDLRSYVAQLEQQNESLRKLVLLSAEGKLRRKAQDQHKA